MEAIVFNIRNTHLGNVTGFSWGIFSHVMHLDRSRGSENIIDYNLDYTMDGVNLAF